MKNIFVATDFSETSINAGKYAVALARHLKARVFLCNGYIAPVEIPESYIFYTAEQVGEQAMVQLANEVKLINKYDGVYIEHMAVAGTDADTIIAEAKNKNADLVVCGMKGSGKIVKKIFGSIATALARKTMIPLLIVPEGASFKLPKNILLASDLQTIPGSENIKTLKEIGTAFDSKLAIVTVIDGNLNDEPLLRERYAAFIDELKSLQPLVESIQGADIAVLLEKYVEDNFINIVAMLPHHHGFLSTIFSGSITKQMAFLSHVPLLILPGKKDSENEIRQTG